ncbi:hypothetical protein KR032_010486 [Drosophila birchii]|nr:hypothetical protein KR032_010486 [Drosophila birchii]
MVQRCSLLFVAALMMVSQVSQAHFPEYCAECEQEVWEQVPCSEVPTTPATPTTPHTTLPPTTTFPPSTTTSRPVVTTTTIGPNVPTTEPPSAYKKCYCECKLGCKEFCRKVVTSNPKQPLTQISSIGEYVSGGQVEFTHVHQRKFIPKYAGEGYSGSVGGPKAYKPPYPLVYERQGAEASPASIPSVASSVASSSPSVASIAAPNYTLEELAQLLSTAYGSKKGYPSAPSRPQLQPAPPSPAVYYSPVYRQGPVEPILSKVLPAPKRTSSIKFAAAAVAASDGVSVAKIKTPYEEKVVVATPSTIYDRTTSYPIIEEVQKVYSQTESYPSQTEAYPNVTPIYPSPTESYPSHKESYPSHKESYPSHKESYPSITESYPSQTDSYPSITESYPSPQPQAKSYGSLESGADKPSSTFDLAIDNYLKDFGYGNQGRGYGDY